MDEDSSDAMVRTLQEGKSRGLGAIELAQAVKDELGERFSAITFVKCFRNAFDIPLSVLQEASRWQGFWATEEDYTGTPDEEFEQLLEPWLGRTGPS